MLVTESRNGYAKSALAVAVTARALLLEVTQPRNITPTLTLTLIMPRHTPRTRRSWQLPRRTPCLTSTRAQLPAASAPPGAHAAFAHVAEPFRLLLLSG